jgi:hypothetical protein
MKNKVQNIDDNLACAEFGKALIPLADGYYQRAQQLAEAGWCSFLPVMEFFDDLMDTLCGPEQRQRTQAVTIERIKEELGRGWYRSKWLNDLRNEESVRVTLRQDKYNRGLTLCERQIKNFWTKSEEDYQTRWEPYQNRQLEFRIQERLNTKGLAQQFYFVDSEPVDPRLKLYKAVMDDLAPGIGFSFDKTISTKYSPVFTKPMHGPWKACVVVNRNNLNSHTLATGGELELSFGLVHKDNKGASPKQKGTYMLFGMELFFPISFWYTSVMYVYRDFFNLEELELHIGAHVAMYKIIQEPFEKALKQGFKSMEELEY